MPPICSLEKRESVHLAVLNTFSHVDLTLNWRSAREIVHDVVPGLAMIWNCARWLMRVQRRPRDTRWPFPKASPTVTRVVVGFKRPEERHGHPCSIGIQ